MNLEQSARGEVLADGLAKVLVKIKHEESMAAFGMIGENRYG